MKHLRTGFSVVVLALSLGACGGGGSGIAFTPPPPPTPTPTPTPTPVPTLPATPTAALRTPVQTASPPAPVATTGSAGFDSPAIGTVFPLLMTAITGDGGGDQATTDAGATLSYGSQGYRFTVNNSAIGIVDKPIAPFWNFTTSEPIIAMWGITDLNQNTDDLDFTRYGYWRLPLATNSYQSTEAGAWVGGYLTPAANIPATGTAEYKGMTFGRYTTNFGPLIDHFSADVRMTADFGASKITGSMTNFMVNEDGYEAPGFAIGFNADLNRQSNLFQGSTQVTSPSTASLTLTMFSTAAKGEIAGHFFGPSAQEAGAVWTLSEGNWRMIGSFGVKH